MAKKSNQQNTSSGEISTYIKGMGQDANGMYTGDGTWVRARNAANNSIVGDLAELSNEAANKLCASAPYTIIGVINLTKGLWATFSTDDVDSEIGLFNEDNCTYQTVVNAPCLNFNKDYLISGQSRLNFDCTYQIYWADSVNPDRTMSIDTEDPDNNAYTSPTSPIPWIQDCVDDNGDEPGGCQICENTEELDCEKLRIEPLIDNMCFELVQGPDSGELLNGSYYVVGAYVVNGLKISDYSLPSNVLGVFEHQNKASSLQINVTADDRIFEEFELVLVSTIAQATTAKRVGVYSTRQKVITIDAAITTWADVPIDEVRLRTPVIETSDAIFKNGPYLLRSGTRERFDFNYQPLANQIQTNWISVEYPAEYYRNAGKNVGYLRDEVYSFFIRWVYNTGDKSPSFHIPGRGATAFDLTPTPTADAEPEIFAGLTPFRWRVYNTASADLSFPLIGTFTDDGGEIIAGGEMGYWESSEFYDDNQPEIWNASAHPWSQSGNPDHDLCGTPIRHHKFPDNNAINSTSNLETNHFNPSATQNKIRVMGVDFSNVLPPVDNDGNLIPGIVGYEILRGSREGNKSIFAKGLINNMRLFNASGGLGQFELALYPNYPYNDLSPDRYLSGTDTRHSSFLNANGAYLTGDNPYSGVLRNKFTFHSPETNFRNPFLSPKEIKVYGEMGGFSTGNFQFADKHPKHKLITNSAFIISVILGLTYSLKRQRGTTRQGIGPVGNINIGYSTYSLFGTEYTNAPASLWSGDTPPIFGTGGPGDYDFPVAGTWSSEQASDANQAALSDLTDNLAGGYGLNGYKSYLYGLQDGSIDTITSSPGTIGGGRYTEREQPDIDSLPSALKIFSALPGFLSDWGKGINDFLELIKAWVKYRQYALQYVSHGHYSRFAAPTVGNMRRRILDSSYLNPHLQEFDEQKVNNLFRSRTVILKTEGTIGDISAFPADNSQVIFKDVANPLTGPYWGNDDEDAGDISKSFNRFIASHYVGLKQRKVNQYGQLRGIIQVPVSTCATLLDDDGLPQRTGPLFNGDTYVGRYTEKNTMFFFYDWLYNLPDGAEFNYRFYKYMPHPRFWVDTEPFDFSEFVSSIGTAITSFNFGNIALPTSKYAMDMLNGGSLWSGLFMDVAVKDAFFYLFNSGVRDFYVESEINIDYRDWGDFPQERHYDHLSYTNIKEMFESPYLKFGNFYKYDYSLSISKLFNNYLAWGNLQEPTYDPRIAELCYTYRPKRVIYSLPQDQENKKDYWRLFLASNYKDFSSRVTAIHPISKNGAIVLLETESPIFFAGVDQLETDNQLKITIGDGGLFSQPFQNMVNSDKANEYGSCQNRLSIVNTPTGMFFMSQNQGKIFMVSNTLTEISNLNMKWWFANFLPYKIIDDFPDFELIDNPVVGVGCQTVYDNTDQIVFFCKKDYALRKDIGDTVTYTGSGREFLVNGALRVDLGDPRYFEDASWTVSYDTKNKIWVSFHDWHPDLTMGSRNTFLTTKDDGIWLHNDVCDLYCNYYGVDYPFEVEFAASSKTTVNTLRSIEYFMEVFKYDGNCHDRFHDLDFNFDEAIIYNTEQCSGLLRLNLKPKNNAPEIITYPQINANNIDILYSKEEQKYRFNQFWDITDDRGEFNAAAERVIFNTEANGYIKNLNANNLNYNKFELERKKFRHYITNLLLRRRVSGNRSMTVIVSINKNLQSPR